MTIYSFGTEDIGQKNPISWDFGHYKKTVFTQTDVLIRVLKG